MQLSELLSRDAVIPALSSTTKEGVIEELSELIAKTHPGRDENEITSKLLEREKLGSTGIENGIAIPHTKIGGLDRIIIAFGRSVEGIDFHAHDGKPSHLFFVLLAPENSTGAHLKTLARLSRLLKEEGVRAKLMEAASSDDIYNIIVSGDDNLQC